MRARAVLLAVVGSLFLIAGVAPAGAHVEDLATPAYEKPVNGAINFWWRIRYDASGQQSAVCFRYKEGTGAWQFPADGDTTGVPPATADRPARSCHQLPSGTDTPWNYTLNAVASGQVYFFCAKEYINYSNIGWQPSAVPARCPGGFPSNQTYDGVGLDGIAVTTQLPTSPVVINDGAAFTNDRALRLRVGYQSALGVPAWPATWVCTITNRPCVNGDGAAFSYEQACSNYPATSASCTRNYTGADGTVHQCVRVADAAIPDPGNVNPFNPATANAVNANLSDATCDSIVVDTVKPAVTASVSDAKPKKDQEVTFTAGATDATSGPSGTFTWDFGDGSAKATGASVKHKYASTGTRTAKVTTTDKAGNEETKTLSIEVTTTGEGGGGTSDGGTVTPPPSAQTISTQSGGGGTQSATAGTLKVLAPKKLSRKKAKRKLRMVLTASSLGKAQVSLRKGSRRVARGELVFTKTGAVGYVLRLPKSLKPGRHKLVIVFTPAQGAKRTITLSLRVT